MSLNNHLLGLILVLVLTEGCATNSTSSTKPYPLDNCVVTDNELGSMGDPASLIYQGQEMKFCCKPCIKKFKANPEKYLKILAEAK